MVNVAILGYGTVGSGVFEVITKNQDIINNKAVRNIKVKYVLDLREFPGDPAEKIVTNDYSVILEDEEINVICETMGGINPAYEFSKQALLRGKSVCTSNKELVANHGPELIRIAKENNCNYLFEASVGGGIPIIRAINYCLTPEKIEGITGILNGTTNYILSKMDKEGVDFSEVLKEAQDKGYAEKNPEADVEGYDACRKIAILSSLMYGKTVDYKDIYTEGITKITAQDFAYAKEMGSTIKLLAISKEVDGKCFAMVAPFILSSEHPLYHVNDVYNGVFVRGNMLDDTMYYGKGAGKLPTASAVVADVIDCARHLDKTVMCFWEEEKIELASIDNAVRTFFVRIKGLRENCLAQVQQQLGEVTVITIPDMQDEFAVITKELSEIEYREKAKCLDNIIGMIRIEA